MITIHQKGFDPYQCDLLYRAKVLAEKVKADLDFVSGIAAMKEPRLMTHLVQSEFLKLDLEFYRPWNPFTSATAYAEGTTIYLNKNAFKRGVVGLLGTLGHEVTHLPPLNYTHDFWATKARTKSIPYAVQNLFEQVGAKLV